jgi:hypothetical protein
VWCHTKRCHGRGGGVSTYNFMFHVNVRRLNNSVLTYFMRTHAFFLFIANAIVLSRVFRGHWNHHFSKLFNVEETKGIIHSQIYPARDVVQSVWYNISALIRCNFIIKNYVNRKITSYIYPLAQMSFIYCHLNLHANLLRPWPFPLNTINQPNQANYYTVIVNQAYDSGWCHNTKRFLRAIEVACSTR